MSRGLRLLPIILLVWILVTLAWRLIQPNDPTIYSQLVNREVPAFELQAPFRGTAGLKSTDLATGRPRLINLFASWCVPCIGEAPILKELKQRGVKIDGIAVRDRPEAIQAFLQRNGNPYDRLGSDPHSEVQLALGSSGVPETFIVDGKGVIRVQHVGPIEKRDVPGLIAEMERLR
jgi:cytochrome c biogenesis protein CcmG/thiol:disulfide interchange protein DsbE